MKESSPNNNSLPIYENKLSIQSPQRRFILKSSGLALIAGILSSKSAIANVLSSNKSQKILNSNLADTQDDILNVLRSEILAVIGLIPDFGSFISAFIGVLWPPFGPDIWDEIKEKVEQLVNQKIDEAIYQLIKNDLTGLGNNLKAYVAAIKTGDAHVISENFVACHQIFINELPQFQSPERQEQLLPLFSIFGILHLSLLREGVLNANKMGWNAATKLMYSDAAVNAVKDYGDYVDKVYSGIQAKADKKASAAASSDTHKVLKFYYSNECYRTYQLAALDFRLMYPYFDPVKYPSKVKVDLTRVLYFGPIGTNDDGDGQAGIESDRTTKLCPPASMSLYSGGYYLSDKDGYEGAVVGFTVRYPDGFGPHGNNNNFFGRHQPDDGNTWIDCSKDAGGPITEVWTHQNGSSPEGIVYSLSMTHKNGSKSPVAGGCMGSDLPYYKFSIPGHILVDIAGQSNSYYYGALGCICIGFQLENMGHTNDPSVILPLIYMSSLQEPTLQKLKDAIAHIPEKEQQFALRSRRQSADIDTFINSNIVKWKEARSAFWQSCYKSLMKVQLEQKNVK